MHQALLEGFKELEHFPFGFVGVLCVSSTLEGFKAGTWSHLFVFSKRSDFSLKDGDGRVEKEETSYEFMEEIQAKDRCGLG